MMKWGDAGHRLNMNRHPLRRLAGLVAATVVSVGVCTLAWATAPHARLQGQGGDRAPVQLTEASLNAYAADVRQFIRSDPPKLPPGFLWRDAEFLDSGTRALTWAAVHGGSQTPAVDLRALVLLNLSAAIEPRVERDARERYLMRAAWVVDAAKDHLPRPFQRRASLAVIWFWQGRRAVQKVVDALGAAMERFGEDADLLLAQGTLWEAIAVLRDEDRPNPTNTEAVERIVDFPGFDLRPRPRWLPRNKIYEQGADTFVRALRRSPSLNEARVRLAHVQLALNRNADAAQSVAPLLNHTAVDGSPVPYLAALLHSRAMLALDRPDAALSSVKRALFICPGCQTARLALSQVLLAGNDRRGAQDIVRGVLEQGPRDVGADPWWEYAAGQAWRLPELVSDMIEEARR